MRWGNPGPDTVASASVTRELPRIPNEWVGLNRGCPEFKHPPNLLPNL
jgi:hypothetical protein